MTFKILQPETVSRQAANGFIEKHNLPGLVELTGANWPIFENWLAYCLFPMCLLFCYSGQFDSYILSHQPWHPENSWEPRHQQVLKIIQMKFVTNFLLTVIILLSFPSWYCENFDSIAGGSRLPSLPSPYHQTPHLTYKENFQQSNSLKHQTEITVPGI